MSNRILCGDVLEMLATIPDNSVDCCVTSPPYWGLRDYGHEGQIGLEKTPQEFVAKMVEVFREVRRVLKPTGTCWVNLGDSYASAWPCNRRNVVGEGSLENGKRENRAPRMPAGLKEKDLCGIPWRVAFGLQDDGWYLRQDIIWHKPNPMPESVRDRCTKAHEYVFLLTKSERYAYNCDAIKERAVMKPQRRLSTSALRKGVPGQSDHAGVKDLRDEPSQTYEFRNRQSVWSIATQPYPEAHFATFPEELPRLCILAGCPEGGVVLDPFAGSGTTLAVALSLGREYIGIELNPAYVKLIERRLSAVTPPLALFTEAA